MTHETILDSEHGPTRSLDTVRAAMQRGGIDTVVVAMVDMQGRLVGKRFHADYFLDSAAEETHACDYLLANDLEMEPVPGYASASWTKGYGDFVLKPDLATFRCLPWLEGTALVIADVVDGQHREIAHSPRAVLKKQLERLDRLGMRAAMASELEFYLFDESFEAAGRKRYHGLTPSGTYIEDYHVFQTTKEEGVMRAVRNGLQGAGIPVESTKGEWGHGQAEINVRYTDALEMADRHVILKNAIKEIAWSHGKSVTFMAKWNDQQAGSSSHIHMSLRDKRHDTSLFHDASLPSGMSKLMQQFVAGQVKHAAELVYFLAPYVNSYKRFGIGTFAPTTIGWSRDNRTSAMRVCGIGTPSIRVECRIGGADLNPYLAFAALIAAGLKGIEDDLPLPAACEGDLYQDRSLSGLPTTLRDAQVELERSQLLRDAFGSDVISHYVHAAAWEQSESNRHVTDWDLMRGFERC